MKTTEENKFSRAMSDHSQNSYYMTVAYGNLRSCGNRPFVVPWQLRDAAAGSVYESRFIKW